jgi:hypothetical protein
LAWLGAGAMEDGNGTLLGLEEANTQIDGNV